MAINIFYDKRQYKRFTMSSVYRQDSDARTCPIVTNIESILNKCEAELKAQKDLNKELIVKMNEKDKEIRESDTICNDIRKRVIDLTKKAKQKDEELLNKKKNMLKTMNEMRKRIEEYEPIIVKLNTDITFEAVKQSRILPPEILNIVREYTYPKESHARAMFEELPFCGDFD